MTPIVWIFDDEELYDHIPELDFDHDPYHELKLLETARCLNCAIDAECCGVVCGVCEYRVCECMCIV